MTTIDEAAVLGFDPFEDDDSDVVTFSNKFVVTRCAWACAICFGPISKGERVRALTQLNREIRSASGRGLGKIMTFRFCPACCVAIWHAVSPVINAPRQLEFRYALGQARVRTGTQARTA